MSQIISREWPTCILHRIHRMLRFGSNREKRGFKLLKNLVFYHWQKSLILMNKPSMRYIHFFIFQHFWTQPLRPIQLKFQI